MTILALRAFGREPFIMAALLIFRANQEQEQPYTFNSRLWASRTSLDPSYWHTMNILHAAHKTFFQKLFEVLELLPSDFVFSTNQESPVRKSSAMSYVAVGLPTHTRHMSSLRTCPAACRSTSTRTRRPTAAGESAGSDKTSSNLLNPYNSFL